MIFIELKKVDGGYLLNNFKDATKDAGNLIAKFSKQQQMSHILDNQYEDFLIFASSFGFGIELY